MSTPQTAFNMVTPTQNNDGSAAATGEITEYVVQVTPAGGAQANYAFTAPATWAPGSTQKIPFASLVPAFTPVAGTAYTADIESEDANGVGLPSASLTWTQAAALPGAPTLVSVS